MQRHFGCGTTLLIGLVGLFLFSVVVSMFTGKQGATPTAFTSTQREGADEFFSKVIGRFVELGMIQDQKTEGGTLTIYVRGADWRLLSYENKMTLLKGTSTANEVRGGTPWVAFRDHNSGKVYAEIRPPLTLEVYE